MKKEESSESALKKLDEQYQKYKFMESNLVQKKMRWIYIFNEDILILALRLVLLSSRYRHYNGSISHNKSSNKKFWWQVLFYEFLSILRGAKKFDSVFMSYENCWKFVHFPTV